MSLLQRACPRPRLQLRHSILKTAASRRHLTNNGFFRVSDEVRESLHSNKPVVALETTIYTHGFPYPENVALASLLESVVRVNGGVPATIGILDGVARVGMSPEELIRLTESAGKSTTLKLSRRDLSYVCGLRLTGKTFNGGTTIAGTMLLAHLAGIKVFGTGGLGGVHRGAESSMDISADLTELGRTPVTVISSGCKSFLDIGRTLEYLETEGVGVGTFADGRTGNVDFPAFWARDSGVKSPTTIENEMEAAAIIHAQNSLQIQSGLHFANPIPLEHEIPKADMDSVIAEAIREADASGASGKDNTPFILNKIKELTGGKSIPANRALIESNVRRAAIVARELSVLEAKQADARGSATTHFTPVLPSTVSSSESLPVDTHPSSPETPPITTTPTPPPVDVLVAGALAVDFSCDYAPLSGSSSKTEPSLHTSNPAIITQTLGGVAHNIAKAAHYLGSNVLLCSAIGDDLSGRAALSQLRAEGMPIDGIQTLPSPARTAQYVAVNNAEKDLTLAMADMSILESSTPESIQSTWQSKFTHGEGESPNPRVVVVDANWSAPTLHAWLHYARSINAYTIFEPVSTAKSTRLFTPFLSPSPPSSANSPIYPTPLVSLTTPNTHELHALHTSASSSSLFSHPAYFPIINALGIPMSGLSDTLRHTLGAELVDKGIPQMCIQLLPFMPTIVAKLGSQGVLLTRLLGKDDPALGEPTSARYILARNGSAGEEENMVGGLYMRLFPVEKIIEAKDVVSVNGIGDTFLGALVSGLVARGRREGGTQAHWVEDVIPLAQRAAGLTLRSGESVSKEVRGLRGEVERLGWV